MAQHFDALVVDCDNEQNATLLFKGARNSGSNQGSLMVAIVEGQAGVARAFRIGANLVLTKPINIEQSKGTLRVARGLLRKGDAAKPAGTVASVAMPIPQALAPLPAHTSVPAPTASSAAFELDAEPTAQPGEAEAALLEYMPDSSTGSLAPQTPAASSGMKQYPWQPVAKPLGEPMASALRRAAEAAGQNDPTFSPGSATPATEIASAVAPAPTKLAARARTSLGSSFAAAAAPAPKKYEEEPEAVSAPAAKPSVETIEPPKFGALGEDSRASNSGGTRKFLLVAIVILAVAAGYLGWSKLRPAEGQPQVQPAAAPAQSAAPAPALQTDDQAPPSAEVTPDSSASPTMEATVEVTRTPIAQPDQTSPESSSKPSATKPAAGVAATTVSASKVPAAGKADEPAAVKTHIAVAPKAQPAAEESDPVAPPAVALESNADSKTLSGIVASTAAALPTPTLKTVKISQGVSEGLVIKRVQPVYPAPARQMRLQGTVQLDATIGKDGNIKSLKQTSGDATLGMAALTAVRQWKYKPYFLNGEPVEVQTQITVNFKLP
jgi:TonB family protein